MNEKLKKDTLDALKEVSLYLYYNMLSSHKGSQYYHQYKTWKGAVDTAIAFMEDEH